MRRNSQRFFLRIQFLESATVLQIQITGIVIVKSNSNSGRRASCALGVHGISGVLLFDIQHLTKTINRELININKLEMNEMNSTKSIISKRVRL